RKLYGQNGPIKQVHTAGACPRTPNEISGGLRDGGFRNRSYRPDLSASTTDLKISPDYKNATYVASRSCANRIRVTN
ncbi:hypothetical protein PanWU01x14_145060, partial [Parasponia andersonii]